MNQSDIIHRIFPLTKEKGGKSWASSKFVWTTWRINLLKLLVTSHYDQHHEIYDHLVKAEVPLFSNMSSATVLLQSCVSYIRLNSTWKINVGFSFMTNSLVMWGFILKILIATQLWNSPLELTTFNQTGHLRRSAEVRASQWAVFRSAVIWQRPLTSKKASCCSDLSNRLCKYHPSQQSNFLMLFQMPGISQFPEIVAAVRRLYLISLFLFNDFVLLFTNCVCPGFNLNICKIKY